MIIRVHPSTLRGDIQAAASKSSMQRACAAALLRHGSTWIYNPGQSNDDRAAIAMIGALGARVDAHENNLLKVSSQGVHPSADSVNCGESGLGIRMFTPLIALSEKRISINGEGSLLQRPMDFFDEIFPKLGISVNSNNGKLPISVQGPLQPATIEIDGSLSSQFLTGLLMAYAAAGAHQTSIFVKNLKSRPYIDLTISVMNHFGWKVENRNYREFYFDKNLPATNTSEPLAYTVEGDWSGGAFLLVAGAIAGKIRVLGLNENSTQADKAILFALRAAGASIIQSREEIGIGPGHHSLQSFEMDATECPDLFPPLVALAGYCKGVSTIRGTSRLTHKESNRALTLQEEFGKMGVLIDLDGDQMHVHGGGRLTGSTVHSHHDHRIAMACAVAALQAVSPTVIEEAQAINKSYPQFYEHLEKLGADLSLINQPLNQ